MGPRVSSSDEVDQVVVLESLRSNDDVVSKDTKVSKNPNVGTKVVKRIIFHPARRANRKGCIITLKDPDLAQDLPKAVDSKAHLP